MRAMNLDRVKAEPFGVSGGIGIGHDHIGDVAFARFRLDLFAFMGAPGRTI